MHELSIHLTLFVSLMTRPGIVGVPKPMYTRGQVFGVPRHQREVPVYTGRLNLEGINPACIKKEKIR